MLIYLCGILFFSNIERKDTYIFEKLLQTLLTQIRQIISFKGFETLLE